MNTADRSRLMDAMRTHDRRRSWDIRQIENYVQINLADKEYIGIFAQVYTPHLNFYAIRALRRRRTKDRR